MENNTVVFRFSCRFRRWLRRRKCVRQRRHFHQLCQVQYIQKNGLFKQCLLDDGYISRSKVPHEILQALPGILDRFKVLRGERGLIRQYFGRVGGCLVTCYSFCILSIITEFRQFYSGRGLDVIVECLQRLIGFIKEIDCVFSGFFGVYRCVYRFGQVFCGSFLLRIEQCSLLLELSGNG